MLCLFVCTVFGDEVKSTECVGGDGYEDLYGKVGISDTVSS